MTDEQRSHLNGNHLLAAGENKAFDPIVVAMEGLQPTTSLGSDPCGDIIPPVTRSAVAAQLHFNRGMKAIMQGTRNKSKIFRAKVLLFSKLNVFVLCMAIWRLNKTRLSRPDASLAAVFSSR